jgi:hypothetical protein
LLASIVFIVEIILVFLGMDNFFIHFTRPISEFLSKVLFQ